MSEFYINISTIEEYTKFMMQNALNLSAQVAAIKHETVRAEEQWQDAVYGKTMDNILAMEKLFKRFDEEIRRMSETLKVMAEKFSIYVN